MAIFRTYGRRRLCSPLAAAHVPAQQLRQRRHGRKEGRSSVRYPDRGAIVCNISKLEANSRALQQISSSRSRHSSNVRAKRAPAKPVGVVIDIPSSSCPKLSLAVYARRTRADFAGIEINGAWVRIYGARDHRLESRMVKPAEREGWKIVGRQMEGKNNRSAVEAFQWMAHVTYLGDKRGATI